MTTPPFARFEWLIAWRYLRARRAEGGVSAMTWISLIGIALAVFALIATLGVRAGFRAEFVDTILGSGAHVTVYQVPEAGSADRSIPDYEALTERLRAVPGVDRAAPLVRGSVLATSRGYSSGVQVLGISAEDLAAIPRVADPETQIGTLERFGPGEGGGVSVGSGVARELGLSLGDRVRLLSPDGARTAFGTSPRVGAYEVVHIFTAGRWDLDRTRIYMPLAEAQSFFNREGAADEIEVMVDDPEAVDALAPALLAAGGERSTLWTWRDQSGAFLRALDIEDNVMFVILSVLVLIAAMNIVSGLIMLVKNKGRDIGILRTMGLTEGTILRVFFICGAGVGLIGTAAGVLLGCLFVWNVDRIFGLVNWLSGGGIWDPSIRGLYRLPAILRWQDVGAAVVLSLFLSFVVTLFPARRAARMNPVEALRYE